MLVAWWRVCACAYVHVRGQMFTKKKRGKETQTLASGPALLPAIICLLAHKPLYKNFVLKENESSLKKDVHFTLIYIEH